LNLLHPTRYPYHRMLHLMRLEECQFDLTLVELLDQLSHHRQSQPMRQPFLPLYQPMLD
jgi:hypothetical protein